MKCIFLAEIEIGSDAMSQFCSPRRKASRVGESDPDTEHRRKICDMCYSICKDTTQLLCNEICSACTI